MVNPATKSGQPPLSLDERKSGLSAPFRRKFETLDWKLIASIDLEKLVQTANVELLDDLISQIVYCRAESEFDSQHSDSGFLKVFKLSQLIIEHLLYCQDVLQEKYQKLVEKCNDLEAEKTTQVKELQALKDTLASAKKELRRRKELLATAQSEIIGDNKDEYDPCPYCAKKFLTTAYLLSHMQRRHQGLPLQPVFPAQTVFHGFVPKIVETDCANSVQSSPRRLMKNPLPSHTAVTQETQTDKIEATPAVNPETVKDIVEKFLEEKIKIQELLRATEAQVEKVNENVQTDNQVSGSDPLLGGKQDETESMKKIVSELKQQLDMQWQYFSGKIQESGALEIKSVVSSEPGEVNSLRFSPMPSPGATKIYLKDVAVQESGDKMGEHELRLPSVSPLKINEEVEERLQKQQHELEQLKTSLQSKVEHDLAALEGKLESQERYWRSKLRSVEDEYASKLTKLRNELKESIEENKNFTPAATPATKHAQVQAEETATESSDYTDSLAASHPPSPSDQAKIPRETQIVVSQGVTQRPRTPPRKLERRPSQPSPPRVPPRDYSYASETQKPVARPRTAYEPPKHSQPTPAQRDRVMAVRSEHEEPDDVLKLEQVEEYWESEEISEQYSSEEQEEHQEGSGKLQQKSINIRMISQEEEAQERMEAMKKQVVEEISSHFRAHGLQPDAEAVTEQTKEVAEKVLSLRRKSLEKEHPDFGRMRETIRKEASTALLDKCIQDRLQAAQLNTPEKSARSPLVKMFSAVKMSGKKMHNRVKLAIKKNPKSPPTPMKPSKRGGFFSRARWRKGKSPTKSPAVPIPGDIIHTSESASETETDQPSSDQEEVEMHYVTKPLPFSSTPVKNKRLMQPSESSGSGSPIRKPSERELDKKKLKVRTNKAPKLRYKESRKNSARTLVRRASTRSSKSKLQGSTTKSNTHVNGSSRKPVRRSLQAEFDNVTPEKHQEIPESYSDATDEEIHSSWEDDDDAGPEENHGRGEHVKLTPSQYTVERTRDETPSPENLPVQRQLDEPRHATKQQAIAGGWKSPRTVLAERSNPVPTARPVTAKPKIVMDSWDNDDDDSVHDRNQVQRAPKPAFVSQRWNDQPIHSNIAGKRVPMDVFTAKPAGTSRPVTAAPRKQPTNPRDSPLNNSWDSNLG